MSEQLTATEGEILAVDGAGESWEEPIVCRTMRKAVPVQGGWKILLPYSAEELLYPLLELNPALKLLSLASNRRCREIKDETRQFVSADKVVCSFRAAADFDMVFCSLLRVDQAVDSLSEALCHCRMLLKPGGHLFLHVRHHRVKVKSFLEILRLQPSGTATALLARAGLNEITECRLSHGQILCSGRRPSISF